MDPGVQNELNAWGALLQTAAVAAEAATVAAGKKWGGRFQVAPEVAALFKEPWEYVPGEKGRKEETRDGSMDDDEDDASSIPDLEPAEKWGQPIPEGFEEETEDTSLLRRMALATMRCDDGVGVWDRSEGEDEGNGDDQDGDARHHGRDEEGRGRKRKRDDVEEEEEGRVVMVAARRMRVSEKRVQVEMTARATLRKAEAVKGVERSGRRPDLEGTWEGRGERRVAWESMNRQKKNHRNKSKAGKRKTGNQKRRARMMSGDVGARQQQDQREEGGEGTSAGTTSGRARSPILPPDSGTASTPKEQRDEQQQQQQHQQ